MKLFFDSSVLVPVFYADHPQHASSAKLFLAAGKNDFCALRTLGEVYATLTASLACRSGPASLARRA